MKNKHKSKQYILCGLTIIHKVTQNSFKTKKIISPTSINSILINFPFSTGLNSQAALCRMNGAPKKKKNDGKLFKIIY